MGKSKKLYMFYLHGKFKSHDLERWILDESSSFHLEKYGKQVFVLYGFTEDEDVAISFMAERNMKRFELIVRSLEDLLDNEKLVYSNFKSEYGAAELAIDNLAARHSVKIRQGHHLQSCRSVRLVTNRYEREYIESFIDGFSDYSAEIFLSKESSAVFQCLGGKLSWLFKELGVNEIVNSIEDFGGNFCLDELFIILNMFGELFNKKVVRKI